MKMNKQIASTIFILLLVVSAFITWKAVGFASDLAMSGKEPIIWLNVIAFVASIALVGVAIYVRIKYGK